MQLLSAPGKLFLAGEYGVLERGRPALVVAVDRSLHAEVAPLADARLELLHVPSGARVTGSLEASSMVWDDARPPELRFAARAVELGLRLCAEEGLAPRGFSLRFLDGLALSSNRTAGAGPKLGLGGSAAATVLAVRAACLAQERRASPEELLPLALAAHWIEQGGSGSGGDVAACSLRGALELRVRHAWTGLDDPLRNSARGLLAEAPLEVTRLRLPSDLRLLLAFSGAASDTRALVAEVRAFALESPARWGRLADEISFASEALRDALSAATQEHGASVAVLACVRRAAAAMSSLGDEAGCQIVTPSLMHIAAVASVNGCAAKPSGAGGGDCAVVFCFGDEARERVRLALGEYDYVTIPLAVEPATHG